jgi:hypothetical protein
MLGGFSLTEATGVTTLRAIVMRIFTPDGTLIVEIDDPSVKVTIEGDGGLVITGAGLEEIRLRPGSYQVQASRDGKPIRLDRELITIRRGDMQIVRVRLDREASAEIVAPKTQAGAFVLLGGKGVAEQRFDTLTEAALGASEGDTIEVRGNGPFVTPPINLGQSALRIRAGPGFRPLIRLQRDAQSKGHYFSRTTSLILEGLEFQAEPAPCDPNSESPLTTLCGGVSLHVVNCRFELPGWICFWSSNYTRDCHFLNCELLGFESVLAGHHAPGSQWRIDNCVQLDGFSMGVQLVEPDPMTTRISHFTYVGGPRSPLQLHLRWKAAVKPVSAEETKWVRMDVSSSILATPWPVQTVTFPGVPDMGIRPASAEFDKLLQRRFEWKGHHNVYLLNSFSTVEGSGLSTVEGSGLLLSVQAPTWKSKAHGPQDLADWKKFWSCLETESLQGHIRLQGGNLLATAANGLDKICPEDFRLHPDSAGYRASKDGNDLGADVDLIGPGKAYEKWKKTPEYTQWLKDTGQIKK